MYLVLEKCEIRDGVVQQNKIEMKQTKSKFGDKNKTRKQVGR